MGSRRLGRRRLYALEKQGQAFASASSGPAITDSVGAYTGLRDGSMVTTNIEIDLANGTAAAYAYSASAAGRVIGASSSTAGDWAGGPGGTNPHSNAQLVRIGPEHGIVTDLELVCVEAPTGGAATIGLYRGSALSASSALADAGTEVVAVSTTQVVGRMDTKALDANEAQGQYLYLVNSGSNAAGIAGAAYTAGKFVLRLHGYKAFADVE